MRKAIIIHDDYIDVLNDGYNIIGRTIYDEELVAKANKLVKELMS